MDRRVIITGDRDWGCHRLARRVLARLVAKFGDELVIVHGAAEGVDRAFDIAARNRGIKVEPHPADWRKHRNAAGPIRNKEMVDLGAEFVVAAHRFLAGSKGTRNCVLHALLADIPVYLFDDEDGEPVRVWEVRNRPARMG